MRLIHDDASCSTGWGCMNGELSWIIVVEIVGYSVDTVLCASGDVMTLDGWWWG